MKLIIFCSLFLSTTISFGQLRKADSYIQKLDNSQFIIDHTQKASFRIQSPAALKLIKIGKPVTEKLIRALGDSTKTIMAQVVLCHIYFKHASFAGPKTIVTDKGDLNKYFLGEERKEGLVISETNINGSYTAFVLAGDREEIIAFWKKKLQSK